MQNLFQCCGAEMRPEGFHIPSYINSQPLFWPILVAMLYYNDCLWEHRIIAWNQTKYLFSIAPTTKSIGKVSRQNMKTTAPSLAHSSNEWFSASDSGKAMLINIYSIYYFTLPKSHFLKKPNWKSSRAVLLLIQFLA